MSVIMLRRRAVATRRGGAVVVAPTYAQEVTTDAPIGWWSLDETTGSVANDRSGSLRNGAYVGVPTLAQAGLITSGSSASFNGTSQYVSIANDVVFNRPTGVLSVEAWIRPTVVPTAGNFATIIFKASEWGLQFNGPLLEWQVRDGATTAYRCQAASGAILAGNTYHVLGTYDGGTMRLYIDGTQVATLPGPATMATTANPVLIASFNTSSEFYSGRIDEVAVYSSTLTAGRVSAHRTAGLAAAPGGVPAIPTGLSAVGGVKSVSLAWAANAGADGVIDYQVYRNDALVANAVTSTAFVDTGLSDGTVYTYRVSARNAAGFGAWTVTAVSATTESAFRAAVAADSPTVDFRMDETSGTALVDSIGGAAGTYVGGVTLNAGGLVTTGSGASFTTGQYATVASRAALKPAPPMTVEAWFKPGAVGVDETIVRKQLDYFIKINPAGTLQAGVWDAAGLLSNFSTTATVVAGNEYYVAMTWSGTTLNLWLGDVAAGTLTQAIVNGPATGTFGSATNALELAAYLTGSTERFAGTLDEVKVYPSVLSQARLQAHYDAGRPVATPPSTGLSAAIPAGAQVGGLSWFNDYEQASPWQKEDAPGSGNWLQILQGGAQTDQITVGSCASFGIPAPPSVSQGTAKKVVHWTVNLAQYTNWANISTGQPTGNYGFPHAKCYTIWGSGFTNPAMPNGGEKGAFRNWMFIPSGYQRWPYNVFDVRFANVFQFKTDNNAIPINMDILPYDNTAGARAGFWLCFNGWPSSINSLGTDGRSMKIDQYLGQWFELKCVLDGVGTAQVYINGTLVHTRGYTPKGANLTWTFGRGHYAGVGGLYTTNASFVPNGT